MSKKLNVFIRPPYRPVDTPPGSWQLLFGFGAELPDSWQKRGLGDKADAVWLEAQASDSRIFAAATGYLSTRYPDSPVHAPTEALLAADLSQADPERINIFLNPRPFLDLVPGFRQRAEELFIDPLSPPDPMASLWRPASGIVEGFFYMNVETERVKAILQEKHVLDNLVDSMASLRLGSTTLPQTTTELEFEMKWRLFLEGKTDLYIRGGEEFGRAATTVLGGMGSNTRQLGFSVLGSDGPIDPARFYDWMRDFVMEETVVDSLLGLIPNHGPLIDPAITTTQLIGLSAQDVLPYNELQQARNRVGLTASQWRLIGENQKKLFRDRLLKRTGHAPADSAAPFFSFNDREWQNLFQLEAVVEFFANFPEPRDPNQVPAEPLQTGGGENPNYLKVRFTPPEGREATANNDTVILDGEPDLDQIHCGHDTIHFNHDTARAGRTYVILGVQPGVRMLQLDGQPNLGSSGNSPWQIRTRPVLVLIDSFGGRLRGKEAERIQTSPDTRIQLDSDVDLSRLNRHGFDTIYLHADVAAHTPPRTYPITDFDNSAKTVTIQGTPDLGGGLSTWHIPAGIGGQLPSLNYSIGKNATRGWDHYDGVLFMVSEGRVDRKFRWSSYTSHEYDPGNASQNQLRSSVHGNALYAVYAYRSNSSFINFAFKVVDEPGHLHGQHATPVPGHPMMIQVDGDQDLQYILHNGPLSGRDTILLYSDTQRSDKTYRIDNVNVPDRILTLNGSPVFPYDFSGWQIRHDAYDGVRNNRFYFDNTVSEDSAAPGARPADGGAGKTEIRLHYGTRNDNNGSGSAGCLVSPQFFRMRNRLIDLYQEEYEDLNGPGSSDAQIAPIQALFTLSANQGPGYSANGASSWNDKILGNLWVIRPEERHTP